MRLDFWVFSSSDFFGCSNSLCFLMFLSQIFFLNVHKRTFYDKLINKVSQVNQVNEAKQVNQVN